MALGSRVGPISLLDSPGIRSAARKADAPPPDSLAAQVSSQKSLAAQICGRPAAAHPLLRQPGHPGALPGQRHP